MLVYVGADLAPVIQPLTVKIFLEARERNEFSAFDLPERKGVGKITFGVFRPLNFPGTPVPYHLDVDVTAPLRRVWDTAANAPVDWLRTLFPTLRPEFLVFSSVQIAPDVAGRRIALAAMVDIINRHLSPGGIVVLNPFPLEYLIRNSPRYHATPEEKQRGVAALKRHYGRIGLQTIETEPDLMVLQRPATPIQTSRPEIRLSRDRFRSMPDVYAYDGLY
ncbi:MAG TPA: hypothetical protein VHE61_13055 [Opitutaceae bacterium]|nr:hypothetical protein [Opitutaceae bacterium]